MRTLRLLELDRAGDRIAITCGLDALRFHFTVRYRDVDLDALARQHGDELVDRLAFHVAMFQINAVASLRPERLELGPWARFATERFRALWRTIFRKVWAQWRYEHDLADYLGPAFVDPVAAPSDSVHTCAGPTPYLAFCGGGKDSLVSLKLLERGGLPFATLGYTHSIYGAPTPQAALLDRLAAASARVRAEHQEVSDDFLDGQVLTAHPELGVKTLHAAETPASVFAALPLALLRGYRGLVVAHEASANTGNLVWHGEEVNHQWGKSWQAEAMLDEYVRQELLADVRYFSILQPIHDELIFELLSRDAALVPLTHSCNVKKPWCGRCPKCAYVWLQMAAHLPSGIVQATFGDDLGERAENEPIFRELLGLSGHTPFECVGSVPEARLALALLPRPLQPRMAALAAQLGPLDLTTLARPFLEVGSAHGMPPEVAAVVMPAFEDAASAARRRLG